MFSPRRYEAYEDVKAALMDAVITRLAARVPPGDDLKLGLLRRLRVTIARMMIGPATNARATSSAKVSATA